MALVKEGLWGFISGTEDCPDQETEAEKHKRYLARKDRALATIVLAIDTSLLYLLGDPQDPAQLPGNYCLNSFRGECGPISSAFGKGFSQWGWRRETPHQTDDWSVWRIGCHCWPCLRGRQSRSPTGQPTRRLRCPSDSPWEWLRECPTAGDSDWETAQGGR